MRTVLKSLALLLALGAAAHAQTGTPVKQSGNVTNGHAMYWVTNGTAADAGIATDGKITSLGVTNNGGPGICLSSASLTAAARNQLCLAATTSGGTKISSYIYGTATTPNLTFDINGTLYAFPFTVGGIVGPNSSTVDDIAVWNNTAGSLLKDVSFVSLCGSHLFSSSLIGCVPASGGGTTNFLRADGTWTSPAGISSITVGTTTISSGTTTRVLFDNAGVLGEYSITGTGSVAMSASPVFTGTLTAATIGGFTLGGTIAGGGNQINNIIIGNFSPQPGAFTNLFATTALEVGTVTTPQSGVIATINGNASASPPAIAAAFNPVMMLIGADLTRPSFSIQGFNNSIGGEPTILLMGARGTGAAPAASQSGDFVGEIFAHPYATAASAGYISGAGSGFIFATTENTTTTAAGQRLDVYTTPTGTATAAFNSSFNASGGLSIGRVPTTISGLLTVSRNATSTPVAGISASPVVHLIGVDGGSASINMQSFVTGGGNGASGYSARGTQASPTAVQTNDILFSINGYGYATSGGAGYLTSAGGGIFVQASENYTSSAAGSKIVFVTTPNGTTSFVNAATLHNSGGLSVGLNTDPGIGVISALNGFLVTTAAKTLTLKQGANGAVGTFICTSGGSITVNNSFVAITDTITISLNTVGGTISNAPALNAITAATSFVAKCATSDTSTYNYSIIKNAA